MRDDSSSYELFFAPQEWGIVPFRNDWMEDEQKLQFFVPANQPQLNQYGMSTQDNVREQLTSPAQELPKSDIPRPDPKPLDLPSVGRIVHFHGSHNGSWVGPCSAIVVKANGYVVNLVVFTSDGNQFFKSMVPHAYTQGSDNNYWGWPPRV